jgi:hypothetical protein
MKTEEFRERSYGETAHGGFGENVSGGRQQTAVAPSIDQSGSKGHPRTK